MSKECCCGRRLFRCAGSWEISRREFLREVGAAAVALAVANGVFGAEAQAERLGVRMPKSAAGKYPIALPRSFTEGNLEAVAMPIGGIGTGTVWLDGYGRLSVWQIFNNYTEERLPGSFFAIRAQADGSEPAVRVLQTAPEDGFDAFKSLVFRAGYPIADVEFEDEGFPVQVKMEAFNPMIPLDTRNSAIPCALFRFTVRNTSSKSTWVSLLGTLQNAVGCEGRIGEIKGVHHPGYGRNRNRAVRRRGMTAVFMTADSEPPVGPVKVRDASGREVRTSELYYCERLGRTDADESALAEEAKALDALARIARNGGVAVVACAEPGFFRDLLDARRGAPMASWGFEVFEDFEGGYDKWTVEGTAFGSSPHTGASPGQQPVSGFMGRGLVNSYRPDDVPRGTMRSKPFRIQRRYIGLLVGGGNYPSRTCVNLRVGDEVVLSATGQNSEQLRPVAWDVSQWRGQEAVIEIVDRHSGGWGHILVDHIVFSDVHPGYLLAMQAAYAEISRAIPFTWRAAYRDEMPEPDVVKPPDLVKDGREGEWKVKEFTHLQGFEENGFKVLAHTSRGEPLLIQGPVGKGFLIVSLAGSLPWSWTEKLMRAALPEKLSPEHRLVPGSPGYGSMVLGVLDSGASVTAEWIDISRLAEQFRRTGSVRGAVEAGPSPEGSTYNSAASIRFKLRPGESKSAVFFITWHFPNVERFGRTGNRYSAWYRDALDVAEYVAGNFRALYARTKLYRDTVYQSNIPPEFIDAITSQSVIFRGPTCYWTEDGYFGAFEGSYGCCPLNCTHVWNYAQTHARLFPEIGRNMRESDLLVYLRPDGEVQHRQHAPHEAFIDGQCATIVAALREHQMCGDSSFLNRVWPKVKLATEWLIRRIDPDEDGVPSGRQPNTYDCEVSGANTFIGSQYLAALLAAAKMADEQGDAEAAKRWRSMAEAGMKNQVARLWNGEYYIQIPETPGANDYNTGCHSDQLLGQWWSHQLNLGYLYPPEQVRSALGAIMRYNFRTNFRGFTQTPRRYVLDDEGGLLICTWPRGGRPNPFIVYADEVWTGIEYAVSGLMVYEGMIDQARRIVATARGRYDGRLRPGLNSGPGGNPFNELECGKFYARAMSSWSLLLACQGLVLDGPKGVIGFKPRWQPEDHRSFFTAPEGWGIFVQTRRAHTQTELLEVRYGRLRVKEMVFELPDAAQNTSVRVLRGEGSVLPASFSQDGRELHIRLARPVVLREGETLKVEATW